METKEKFLTDYPDLANQIKIFKYSIDDKMVPGKGISYDKLYKIEGIDYLIYRKDPAEIDAFNMGDTVEEGIKDIKEESKKLMNAYIIQTRQAIERLKQYEAQNK